MGWIADAELASDVEQHPRRPTCIGRQRTQFNIKSASNLERIYRSLIDSQLLKELIGFAACLNEWIGPPCHLVPFSAFFPRSLRKHTKEIVGHFLIFSRQAGIVAIEPVGTGR